MLDDDNTAVVVTASDYAAHLVDELRTGGGSVREVFRALQPYIVGLPTRIAERPEVRTLLVPVTGDLMQWRGEYDPAVGIEEGASVNTLRPSMHPNTTLHDALNSEER